MNKFKLLDLVDRMLEKLWTKVDNIIQEAVKLDLYSHLSQNFPQFVVVHKVKGLNVVNEAERDAFLEFSCFFYDPTDVDNLISGSSPFSKSSL